MWSVRFGSSGYDFVCIHSNFFSIPSGRFPRRFAISLCPSLAQAAFRSSLAIYSHSILAQPSRKAEAIVRSYKDDDVHRFAVFVLYFMPRDFATLSFVFLVVCFLVSLELPLLCFFLLFFVVFFVFRFIFSVCR